MTSDFDARAQTWDDDPAKSDRAKVVADAIVRQVAPTRAMKGLEYGSGTGLLSFMLRPHLGAITLIDTSAGMLEVADRKIAGTGDAGMRTLRIDLLTDTAPQERYDIVYSLMVLHHVPDTPGILRRFHDVLSPGGVLCIADLDAEDGSFHGEGFDGHLGFDRTELGAKTRAAGFRAVEFSTVHEIRRDTDGHKHVYPVFLMVARKD